MKIENCTSNIHIAMKMSRHPRKPQRTSTRARSVGWVARTGGAWVCLTHAKEGISHLYNKGEALIVSANLRIAA